MINLRLGDCYKFIKEIPRKEDLFKGSLDDFDIHQVRYEINQGAFEKIERSVFTALDEAKKGILGQAAKDVVDSVVYLAGFAGMGYNEANTLTDRDMSIRQ